MTKLYVEGKLDAEWLNRLLEGLPPLEIGGSKEELPHLMRRDRDDKRNPVPILSWFLRDRDFDYLPDNSPGHDPCRVVNRSGNPLCGYRWRRHEIENYLIDPVVIEAALGIPHNAMEAAISAAAQPLLFYEAARWTVGQMRTELPRPGLDTRYDNLGDYQLPGNLTEANIGAWLEQRTSPYREAVTTIMSTAETMRRFTEFCDRLRGLDAASILIWYSGKDLLAALIPFFESKFPSCKQPDDVLRRLADWRDRPTPLDGILPEWDALKLLLQAA